MKKRIIIIISIMLIGICIVSLYNTFAISSTISGIDKTYARIDGGTASPGYLTLKTS